MTLKTLLALLSIGWTTWPTGGGSSGGSLEGPDLSVPPTPLQLYCVTSHMPDATYRNNAVPTCYAFESKQGEVGNATVGPTAIRARPDYNTGSLWFEYTLANMIWKDLPGNTLACGHAATTPYAVTSPCTITSAMKLHHITGGSQRNCNGCGVVSWDAGDPWTALHMIGSASTCDPGGGAVACVDVGGAYSGLAEDAFEFLDPNDADLRNMMVAHLNRLKAFKCSDGSSCPFMGVRLDEPNIAYGPQGLDWDDVVEYNSPSAYVSSYAAMLRDVGTRSGMLICPSLPGYYSNYTEAWERQLIRATGCMATEQLGNSSYTRVCDPAGTDWTGVDACNEVARTPLPSDYDDTLDSLSTFSRILHENTNPHLTFIGEPFRACRGAYWLQEMCAAAKARCFFDYDPCRSALGTLSGISNN